LGLPRGHPKWSGVACGHPQPPLGGGAGPSPGIEGGRMATPKGRGLPRGHPPSAFLFFIFYLICHYFIN
jgi:hypothetical protein